MFHDLFSDLHSPRRATRVAPNLHDRNDFFMIVPNRYMIMDSLIVDHGGDNLGKHDPELKIDCDWAAL
jgi:hypothetical protein